VWNWKFHGAWITPTLSLVACLALWEAVVRYAQVPVYLVPAPSLIATKLVAAYPLFLQETLHSVVSITLASPWPCSSVFPPQPL
jgi:NitT/TauT family transport system permease protein